MNKQHKHFKPIFKWWLIFCSVIFATVYAQLTMDLFGILNAADVTKLSIIVIGIFYAYMIHLGVNLSKFCKNVNNQFCEKALLKSQRHGWFIAGTFLAVGLIGTLVGFIFMLDLTGLSSGDAAQATLITLSTGMKTAIYTTLMALISATIIRCTLYVVNSDLEEINECFLTN